MPDTANAPPATAHSLIKRCENGVSSAGMTSTMKGDTSYTKNTPALGTNPAHGTGRQELGGHGGKRVRRRMPCQVGRRKTANDRCAGYGAGDIQPIDMQLIIEVGGQPSGAIP